MLTPIFEASCQNLSALTSWRCRSSSLSSQLSSYENLTSLLMPAICFCCKLSSHKNLYFAHKLNNLKFAVPFHVGTSSNNENYVVKWFFSLESQKQQRKQWGDHSLPQTIWSFIMAIQIIPWPNGSQKNIHRCWTVKRITKFLFIHSLIS